MTLPPFVEIVEVSPRDGLQNEKVLVSTDDKIALIEQAVAAGAKRIEAVSFVNPKAVPQMADADDVMRRLRGNRDLRAEGVAIAGLILNKRGFDRAVAAQVDEVNFAIVASETFNKRNQGAAIADTMKDIVDVAAQAKDAGLRYTVTIGAAFGCPFEGEVPVERVFGMVDELAALGVTEIALADTIGVGDPWKVEQLVEGSRQRAPKADIRLHLHDTRNTGVANAYAAVRAGVKVLDASIGGIGGCPFAPAATGNIATEDTVYMLERMGVKTGFDIDRLIATAQWLGGMGLRTSGALMKSGPFPGALSEPCISVR